MIAIAQRNVATLATNDSDLFHGLSQLSGLKYHLAKHLHQFLVLSATPEENAGLKSYISSAVRAVRIESVATDMNTQVVNNIPCGIVLP